MLLAGRQGRYGMATRDLVQEALNARVEVGVDNRGRAADYDNRTDQNRDQEDQRAHGAGVFQISEHWICPPWLRSLGWTRDSPKADPVCLVPPPAPPTSIT